MQSRAKEIFQQFDGSRFHMSREGALDAYVSSNPTPEQERAWRRELIEDRIREAEAGDRRAVTSLLTLNASEALPALAPLAARGDGLSRLMLAEAIWRLADSPRAAEVPEGEVRSAIHAADAAARELVGGGYNYPAGVSDEHLDTVGASDARSYLAERAQRGLSANESRRSSGRAV